jgi:methylenetetrahydrofolate reductase (NADPH)
MGGGRTVWDCVAWDATGAYSATQRSIGVELETVVKGGRGTGGASNPALLTLLRHVRYEVVPVGGVEEQVERWLDPEITVTITASPARGLGATLDLAERLAGLGFHVVPHLSARLVVDSSHLGDILARLTEAGIHEAFVIAGDRSEPVGAYADALSLLSAMSELPHGIREIGISGYPESHPFIDDDVTIQAMWDKRRFATYIVSNLCFDARVITAWVDRVRRRGVELPIYVGVPGIADPRRLLRMAVKIGVGDSVRFLRGRKSGLMRMVLPGGYSLDRILAGLAPEMANPARRVAGLHVFTFNEIAATERWRRQALQEGLS